jgi:para-aminobenzoate synthetase component I
VQKSTSFTITNFTEFKIQMLNWANQFNIFCLLDNQHYNFDTPNFECLLGVDAKKNVEANAGNAFEQLKQFSNTNNKWLFGHFGYDLKNELEDLQSNNADGIGFADMHFFVPQFVLKLTEKNIEIFCDDDATVILKEIKNCSVIISSTNLSIPTIKNRIEKDAYLKIINKLKEHIAKGDCYEINFCQEFFAEDVFLNPIETYNKLTQLSPNPFSVLYKLNDKFCICASPERYLKKEGNKIFSQPIKGTSKRNLTNKILDDENKNNLLLSEKERSENVMIVDLVRNDLSKICLQGSVKVEELFGLYSFPQVHQMISTISGTVDENTNWVEIIKATFPMGSMTGAPKKRVMQLIEQYEQTKRGLFSGAIGYVSPDGNFDFNVVIRSIFYNATSAYLSFTTGGAITFNSNAANEYEECLLKAEAILKVLE